MKTTATNNVAMLAVAIAFAFFFASSPSASAQAKREFRGAWIQCVNGQFLGMSTETMQRTLASQLDELQRDGLNAIIFQVRPECDALYQSDLEPWSRWLTGEQGRAPSPYWDPLQWMITQCHARGMELHAWINPYRAKTKPTKRLAPSHIAAREPQRVFEYDGLYILNPGLPENRDYICQVAADIVSRYDIDGLHIDDYFYPYPVAGKKIPDEALFRQNPLGFTDIGDWRRYNVSRFVEQLHETIAGIKPWVKFGVSPFGIYRNQRSHPDGSQTNGLQNYDDLYADVLLWTENGWVDYNVPQLYWHIGNKAADYETLIRWWNEHAANRPLFIGEDVERTVKHADRDNPRQNQMPAKFRLHEQMDNVSGKVLWYAKLVADNVGNYGTMLRNVYWRTPALQPLMPFITERKPKKVRKLKAQWTPNGYILSWAPPRGKGWEREATKYVIYRFAKGQKANYDDPNNIVAITADTQLKLPYNDGTTKYTYAVSALNRIQNEGKPKKENVKL